MAPTAAITHNQIEAGPNSEVANAKLVKIPVVTDITENDMAKIEKSFSVRFSSWRYPNLLSSCSSLCFTLCSFTAMAFPFGDFVAAPGLAGTPVAVLGHVTRRALPRQLRPWCRLTPSESRRRPPARGPQGTRCPA